MPEGYAHKQKLNKHIKDKHSELSSIYIDSKKNSIANQQTNQVNTLINRIKQAIASGQFQQHEQLTAAQQQQDRLLITAFTDAQDDENDNEDIEHLDQNNEGEESKIR